MSEICKYTRTHHIEGSRFQVGDEELDEVPFAEIAGRYVVIEEKLDGANSGISFSPEGNLLLQSRGYFLLGGAVEKHFNLFKQWANVHAGSLREVLGSRYILHARNGARMARQILWQMDDAGETVPFHYREMIVGLVRLSALPFFLFEKSDPLRSIIQASQVVRCDWLAILEEADALNRVCDDRKELLNKIELFREYCLENDCLDHPRQFASAHSRFVYFHKVAADPNYEAYDDTHFEVVLMSGLPGAGKDRWIQSHLPFMPVISLDAIRKEMKVPSLKNQGAVAAKAKERAREYLRTGSPFVWNATNITGSMRAQLIDLFSAYKARVRIVYVECPYQELMRRNRSRANFVPAAIIQKLASKLDIPDTSEAHDLDWAV